MLMRRFGYMVNMTSTSCTCGAFRVIAAKNAAGKLPRSAINSLSTYFSCPFSQTVTPFTRLIDDSSRLLHTPNTCHTCVSLLLRTTIGATGLEKCLCAINFVSTYGTLTQLIRYACLSYDATHSMFMQILRKPRS